MDKAQSNETTLVMRAITDDFDPDFVLPYHLDRTIVEDAVELASDLWPRPADATVTLEPGDWTKIRRVLLAVPQLWLEANK